MWAGSRGYLLGEANTICAPLSSFIFPFFLIQQISRYGTWTVIFPVCDVRVDKMKADEMHTKL